MLQLLLVRLSQSLQKKPYVGLIAIITTGDPPSYVDVWYAMLLATRDLIKFFQLQAEFLLKTRKREKESHQKNQMSFLTTGLVAVLGGLSHSFMKST